MMTVRFILILLYLFISTSCSDPPEDYSSYESAVAYVRHTYEADVMKPEKSTIHRVEYFPSSSEKWLIVYFKRKKGKGYIYQSFPAHKWDSWQRAKSKGKWYVQNLKGKRKYFFYPD